MHTTDDLLRFTPGDLPVFTTHVPTTAQTIAAFFADLDRVLSANSAHDLGLTLESLRRTCAELILNPEALELMVKHTSCR
jgi:hypothetical protein